MPTFDGDNLVVILDSGVTVVDVKVKLYSDWKEWFKTGTNSKYPLAMRAIAGDPKGSITAAPTFFFRNDLGWRIRPPEENITITLIGDLQAEDTSLPMIVPTIGTYTVLVLGAIESIVAVDAFKENLDETRRFLRNKRFIDTATGIETIYDDTGAALFTRQIYNDDGVTPYDGTVVPHRVDRYA